MANRDYYGNNVPTHLAGEQAPQELNTLHVPEYASSQATPSFAQQPWDNNNPSYEQSSAYYEQQQRMGPNNPANINDPEGEKGLGATVVGGTGGAFVGHKVGKKSDHGTLGAIGGAVAGAIMANMASNMVKGNHGQGHGSGHGVGHGLGLGGSLRDRRVERLERRLGRLH